MAYGDKRDFRKIDIYATDSFGNLPWRFVSSTTWARTCKEAAQHWEESHSGEFHAIRVKAQFA